ASVVKVRHPQHAVLARDSLSISAGAVTGSAVDIVTLLTAQQQCSRDSNRNGLNEIGRAWKTSRVNLAFFIGRAARDRAGDRQARTKLIRKKLIEGLRAQLWLAIHVRKNLQRRTARSVAAEPRDADHDGTEKNKSEQKVAHLFLHQFDMSAPDRFEELA